MRADPDEEPVDVLVERAGHVRSRIVGALDALERRRERVKRGLEALAIVGAALAVSGVALLAYRAATSGRRRARARWALARRAWRRPESLAHEDATLAKLARSLATTLVPILFKRLLQSSLAPLWRARARFERARTRSRGRTAREPPL